MATTSYDDVPYDSQARYATHPDCFAVLATILGMKPAAVDRCRVLELGCGTGGNLVPMALVLPQSRFLGLDLSTRQIDSARALAGQLDLANIEFRACDLLEVGPELGQFDYIICHGVYSWVPRPVQEQILRLCKSCLAPQGVAYISYNTYPGWHLRSIVREATIYHTRRFDEPRLKVEQARAFLAFLVKSAPNQDGAYVRALRDETERWQEAADYYLFHEHLEDDNQPVYFHEFAGRAADHGLQYLGEAGQHSHTNDLSAEAKETLQGLAEDLIQREQYLDFLRNRSFRRTLLCHAEVALSRTLAAETLDTLRVAALARPIPKPAGADPEVDAFVTDDGVDISTNAALIKALLHTLHDSWPAALTLDELGTSIQARFGPRAPDAASLRRALGPAVAQFFLTNVLRLHSFVPPFAAVPGVRPRVTPLARLQARQGTMITTLRHSNVRLPDLDRRLVSLLDGTRDRPDLLRELLAAVAKGELAISAQGERVTDVETLTAILKESIESGLPALARSVLLLPEASVEA